MRGDAVYRMSGETGKLESLETDLDGFLKRAQKDPVEYLSLNPLMEFQEEGGKLTPGQLLNVLPPFIMKESENGASMRAIPAADQLKLLADFSKQTAGANDGAGVTMKVVIKPPGH